MKIAALISVVAAGRQVRDAQSLYDKMIGDNIGQARGFKFSETDSLYQVLQFYLSMKGMVHTLWLIVYGLTLTLTGRIAIIKPSKGQDVAVADNLLDYGCWCRLRNEEAAGIVSGHGTPVDALDEACKAWHQCRACTSMDFQTCNPNNIAYEVGFNPISMRIDCQWNPSDCDVSNNILSVDALPSVGYRP